MHVLTLEIVHVQSVHHVAEVGESLGAPHGLEKMPRLRHFGHEVEKDLGTAVGVDGVHETVDRSAEVERIGKTGKVRDCRIVASSVGLY